MSREQDLQLITAYALGELHGPEKVRIENLIRNDQVLQQTVQEIRKTAGFLVADLKSPSNSLSSVEKTKVEQGWKDLAAKESRSRFYRRTLGAVSAMAAAVFAFAIVKPNVAQFSQSPAETQLNAPAAKAPAQKEIADSERSATFVKIEKKEVNAEVGSQVAENKKDSGLREGRPAEAFGGSGPPAAGAKGAMALSADSVDSVGSAGLEQSVSKSARTAAAPMKLKSKSAPLPVSVLFGGDGEVVSGVPDNKSVKEKLREKTGELTACYLRVLESQPGTKGKLILQWGIKKGRATGVSTASSTLGNASLESCIVTTVKGVHFGPESNGAKVVMPFHFMSPN